MNCRHCLLPLEHIFLDLGFAPPSNAYLLKSDLIKPEKYFPLKLFVCSNCWLVQTDDYAQSEDLFNHDYAYFSSTSKTWLIHAYNYCHMVKNKLNLTYKSFVVEIAANDGYLLKNFLQMGIPCLGVEPTDSTANAAEKLNIPIIRSFFGLELANKMLKEGKCADLVLGNNVFAHVPDINDFTMGIKNILKPNGTVTLEFPHLLSLLEYTQFDTVYHEHFSYLSLYSVKRVFEKAGLKVIDVEELSTHGGSLRVYGCHQNDSRQISLNVDELILKEKNVGMQNLEIYKSYQNKVNKIKDELVQFLINEKRNNKIIIAYGAAAKGCTLLNYAGIKPDLLPLVCDAAESKQNKYLPGSHIPIFPPIKINELKPDFILILPWNIKEEVMDQLSFVKSWGAKFVTAIPQIQVL